MHLITTHEQGGTGNHICIRKRGPDSSISCPSARLVWTLLGSRESTKKGNCAQREAQSCEPLVAFAGSFIGSLQGWAPVIQSLRQTGLWLRRVGVHLQRKLPFFTNCLRLVTTSWKLGTGQLFLTRLLTCRSVHIQELDCCFCS